jgi:hypothetical protein
MGLTPQQREQIDRQRRENPGQRIMIQFTDAQREEWRKLVDAELASKQANLDRIRAIEKAAKEPGLSGDLRRAILSSLRPGRDIAKAIDVPLEEFEQFQIGEGVLASDAIDRLARELGLRLVADSVAS